MSFRNIALAALGALALAACSDEDPTGPHVVGWPPAPGPEQPGEPGGPVASMIIDAGVACDGSTMPAVECQALVALYNSTNGPGWTESESWGTDPNPCNWEGVDCTEGDHGSVRWLARALDGLAGPIPAALGNLTSLEYLNLLGNELTGPIPPELGSLPVLEDLLLGFNELSGTLPPELGNLTALRRLDLNANNFTGSIPAAFGNLANLVRLGLEYNELTGPIPVELGGLAKLRVLRLQENALSGGIPASLGNITGLDSLELQGNALTGSIPASLGSLGDLILLNLNGNDLSGAIPATLGNLTSLHYLVAGGNALGGPLPASLGNLTGLKGLYLPDNAIGGPIPPELGNLTALHTLNLGGNQLTGAIPASLAQLDGLWHLVLEGNQLAGVVPVSVAALGESIPLTCTFVPGNAGVYLPDVPAYRAADTNGDGAICGLPFADAEDIGEDAVGGIEDLVPDPLGAGQANALTSKLENAMAKAAAGQYQAAINQMLAFTSQLNTMVADGTLTAGEAAPFLEQAAFLIQIWTAML